MAEIKWIKIVTDIFDDEKIKLIEKLPEGDTMLVIWLKLLAMAGKRNDSGLVYITRDIPFTADTLADVMNRDSKIVSLALNTFASFGMIEILDNFIQVVNWEKHQNIEGMEQVKELRKLRNKRYYEKQKLIKEDKIKTSYKTKQDTLDKIRIDKKRKEKKERFKESKVSFRDNIELTKKEHSKLIGKYGEESANILYDFLSAYKIEKDYKTKSDYLTILRWVVDACKVSVKPQELKENNIKHEPIEL